MSVKAAAIEEARAHCCADGARGDHADIDEGRRLDETKSDIVAAGENQQMAARQIGRNLFQINFWQDLVGNQQNQDVTAGDHLFDVLRLEAVFARMLARVVMRQADERADAGIAQIIGDRPSQVAEADDADRFAAEQVEIGVFFAINLGHCDYSMLSAAIRFCHSSRS